MIKDIKETAINIDNESDRATYFAGQKKYINKLLKQAEKYPEYVKIKVVNPDGSIVAEIPNKWFKAPAPPAKRTGAPMSEERKAAGAERLKKYRESKKNGYV